MADHSNRSVIFPHEMLDLAAARKKIAELQAVAFLRFVQMTKDADRAEGCRGQQPLQQTLNVFGLSSLYHLLSQSVAPVLVS